MTKTALLLTVTLLSLGAFAQTQTEADWVRESVFRVLVDSSELKRQGNYDGALAMLSPTLDEDLSPYESALVNEALANTFNMTEDYQSAREHYRVVVDNPVGLDSSALNRVWYRMATSIHQLGDYEGVVQHVGRWLERVDEPSLDAYKILAFAHFELGNRAAALEGAEQYATLLREAGQPIPASTAAFLEHLRRPEGETSDILTSELSDLASPETLQLLVRANDMIGRQRYKDAANLLSGAIAAGDATATEIALLREKLAWALASRKDMDSAREQLKAITESPARLPDNMLDMVWMRLAAASYRVGAFEEAIDSANTWRARTGKADAQYFRLVAMSHWQLNDREVALKHGKRYIELAHSKGEEIPASFKALLGDALAEELGSY